MGVIDLLSFYDDLNLFHHFLRTTEFFFKFTLAKEIQHKTECENSKYIPRPVPWPVNLAFCIYIIMTKNTLLCRILLPTAAKVVSKPSNVTHYQMILLVKRGEFSHSVCWYAAVMMRGRGNFPVLHPQA